MNETIFEKFGGTYTKQGDYLLPNLILPAEVFFASTFCIKLQKVFVGCCTYIL